MRHCSYSLLTLALAFGFAGTARCAEPRLKLSDEGLPLQEIRPLDRRDYILALEGTWSQPAAKGTDHFVNLFFPDGGSYAHKVLSDRLFALGDVRVILPEHLLQRHGVARGGKIVVVVSAGRPATTPGDAEVVSNALAIAWPLKRPVVTQPVRTKHVPPPPVDAFPVP
jgi:hypothetical protein